MSPPVNYRWAAPTNADLAATNARRDPLWRRIAWPAVVSHVLVAIVGMAALILAMGVLR
ncbi:MAG: hypothetical protein IT337_13715 [Thermomicrobiales bacterium]|nr:hypothetical protein [Thermomicrobiales bacterium]